MHLKDASQRFSKHCIGKPSASLTKLRLSTETNKVSYGSQGVPSPKFQRVEKNGQAEPVTGYGDERSFIQPVGLT